MKRVFEVSCAVILAGNVVALAEGSNLLSNASFETESAHAVGYALHWKLNDPDDHGDSWGSASRESWRAHRGQFMIAIRGTWANSGDYGGIWQEAQGRAEQTYRASGWFYADVGWTATVQEFKLEFWNWDRSQLLGSTAISLEDVGETWSKREVSAVAPAGTEWVRLVVNVSGAGPTGALQIDDVSLESLP